MGTPPQPSYFRGAGGAFFIAVFANPAAVGWYLDHGDLMLDRMTVLRGDGWILQVQDQALADELRGIFDVEVVTSG